MKHDDNKFPERWLPKVKLHINFSAATDANTYIYII